MSKTDDWLSPPEIIDALGSFDLDPCTPIVMPWRTAAARFTIIDDGLFQQWFGRVWMNPPYSKLLPWMHKMSEHGNGVVLLPSKTDTKAFHTHIFPKADSIFFFQGRLTFLSLAGIKMYRAPFMSCLVSYGEQNADAIDEAKFKGRHVPLNRIGIVVIGFDATWQTVMKTVFIRLNRPATLDELYEQVESLAPDKIRKNVHFKAKIRQTMQMYFKKVGRGIYSN